jgi:hypothetical protein
MVSHVAGGDEFEPDFLGQLLHIGFLDVPCGGDGIDRAVRGGAVLFHPEHAARFQRLEHLAKNAFCGALGQQRVQIIGENGGIDRIRQRQHGRPVRHDGAFDHSEPALIGKAGVERFQRSAPRRRRRYRILTGHDEPAPAARQIGRQHRRQPAASGQDFKHGHAGFNAPEAQHLDWMAPFIALGLDAPLARRGPFQRAWLDDGPVRSARRRLAAREHPNQWDGERQRVAPSHSSEGHGSAPRQAPSLCQNPPCFDPHISPHISPVAGFSPPPLNWQITIPTSCS